MSLAARAARLAKSPTPPSPLGAGENVDADTNVAVEEVRQYVGADPEHVRRVVAAVRERMADIPDRAAMSDEKLQVVVEANLATVLAMAEYVPLDDPDGHLRSAVLDDLLGFGPLQDLLDDASVSEIMVNGPNRVFIESRGTITRTNRVFDSEEQLMRVIDRMVRTSGRRVDQSSPMVDARLPDGSRLNVVLPPLAVDGASVTVRKFTARHLTIDDLVANGALSADAARFLERAVVQRMNILVSGGTGTGKTTVLNLLSSFIGRGERVVSVEDAVELTLDLPNLVRLESRPANSEGAGHVSIRDLVRNALRMRPDRIVVGEVRGAEALDMLQAMNTGHEGSLSTLHANSARDTLRRLETMVLFGGVDLPLRAVREQVASAVNLIVQLTRDARGRRFVTSITEVAGMEGEVISTSELFSRGDGHEGGAHASRGDGDVAPLLPTGVSSLRLGATVERPAQ